MASITAKKRKKRENYSLEELKILGHHLLSSRVHINNLPVLITFISPSSRPQHALESLLSLQSFFFPVLSELARSSSKPIVDGGEDDSNIDPEVVYRSWLRAKFDEFVQSLIALAVSPDSAEALRDVALDAIMEFVKKGKEGKFQSAIYHRFLNGIVYSALPVDFLLDLLASKFFKYIDVRYFTYISLDKLARSLETTKASGQGSLRVDGKDDNLSNTSVELSIHKMYYILSHVSPLKDHDGKSDYENWSEQGFSSTEIDHKGASEILHPKEGQKKTKKFNSDLLSTPNIVKRMKLKFTKAWLSFLRLPLPLDVYKEVLVTLHQAVIPHMSNPALLCDFLTRSYDIGGVISVMALSGLYILMIQHGLEYPNFYEKLYALPLPSIFMAKHRSKFFQLLDSCLRSPLLPAYLAAAFAKKLSRLTLLVPPSGALVIIALIHNLLRRHPSINFLVHREDEGENDKNASESGKECSENPKESITSLDAPRKRGIDYFDYEESDPAKSNAMRSSLWEIDTLRHHYCPAVSRFVTSLENDLTTRARTTEVAIDDFSSGSYATIFRSEVGRRIKQVPLAYYKSSPTSLFSESDFTGWTFKFDKTEREETTTDLNSAKNICGEDEHGTWKRQRTESS